MVRSEPLPATLRLSLGLQEFGLSFEDIFRFFFFDFVLDEVLLHRPGWPRPCCVLALSSQRSTPLCLPVLALKMRFAFSVLQGEEMCRKGGNGVHSSLPLRGMLTAQAGSIMRILLIKCLPSLYYYVAPLAAPEKFQRELWARLNYSERFPCSFISGLNYFMLN